MKTLNKEAADLAHEIHSTFASAYAIDAKVNHEYLESIIRQALQRVAKAAKDDGYAKVARALGFEGNAWFGDPLADHAEIVAKARTMNQQLKKAREIEKASKEASKEQAKVDHLPDRPLNYERE